MSASPEIILIAVASLVLLSIIASKISDRFGIPALLLFLLLGMLAGSDGPGGIYFDDPALAQFIGVIALALILFSGGLDTEWQSARPVVVYGLLLSTVGVFLTALVVGLAAQWLLGFSLLQGLLVGAIVSSTDAAAVFSILRSKGINLKGNLRPLLELESGSNDPMAVFLTVGVIQLLTQPQMQLIDLLVLFVLQMVLGAATGYGMGRLLLLLANRLHLGYEGLYPVLSLAMVLLTYGLTDLIGGNGFLAVYLAGIVAGSQSFIHKRSLSRFHDGMAWLMQIAMFLTLGLLVFPTQLVAVIGGGLLIALVLVFVARPVSIYLTLAISPFNLREKAFLSWVGLRGAVPIVLATFPFLASLPQANLIFNVVFFIVLISVLLQGTTVPWAARWFGVDAPGPPKRVHPLEYNPIGGIKSELRDLPVPAHSVVVGKRIVELVLPAEFLIVLIARDNDFILPSGATMIMAGDTLVTLAEGEVFQRVKTLVNSPV
jgi:cell volume regulation protein A